MESQMEIIHDYQYLHISNINKRKVKHNLELIENLETIKDEYPYLYKRLNRIARFLTHFLDYSKDKVINSMQKHKENPIFFCSYRHLATLFSSKESWSRNINIFITLGLIKKHKAPSDMMRRKSNKHTKEIAERKKVDKFKIRDINYYSIPLYDEELLVEAERIAEILKENNFRANAFSKIYLIKVFGKEFADSVFLDDRYISEYSNYVSSLIESFILDDIKNRGYTTKNDIITSLKFKISDLDASEYGFGLHSVERRITTGTNYKLF